MNPDFEDPNNHVPPVSDGDEWDDVGDSKNIPRRVLPPKRSGSAPAKIKDLGIAPINKSEPELRIGTGGESESEEEKVSKLTSASEAKKAPRRKNSVKPAGKVKRSPKSKKRPAAAAGKKAAGKTNGDEVEEVLPAQDVKRGRVNELGSKEKAAYARPDPAKMSPEGLDRSKMAGGGRKWAKDAEGRNWGSRGSAGSFKWMVYSGLGAMALVVTIVLLSFSREGEEERIRNQSYFSQIEVNTNKVTEEEEFAQFEELSKSGGRAKEIYESFAKAKTPVELEGMIYDEEKILPIMAENWEPLGYPESWAIGDKGGWSIIKFEGLQCGILEGQTPDYDKFRALFRIDGNKLEMDWKATVAYSTASFEELRAGKGDASEVRGFLSNDTFYTFSYPEADWVAYRLVSANGDADLRLYAARGGEIAKKFSEAFNVSRITGETKTGSTVTLALKPGNEQSLAYQWEIEAVKAMSWLEE